MVVVIEAKVKSVRIFFVTLWVGVGEESKVYLNSVCIVQSVEITYYIGCLYTGRSELENWRCVCMCANASNQSPGIIAWFPKNDETFFRRRFSLLPSFTNFIKLNYSEVMGYVFHQFTACTKRKREKLAIGESRKLKCKKNRTVFALRHH